VLQRVFVCFLLNISPGGDNLEIKKLIEENIETIKEIRKILNLNAELSFKEYNTQSIIIDFLKDLDMDTEIFASPHPPLPPNRARE
jgi:hypothetical protein